ncbi:hypothetical protein [Arthrobacter sp. NA-172]|uniref:hypothetical protein n=1 Tax=Arthrobacter sp. NA-172 TaxID=3367524 RepID=UPI003754E4E2
MNQTRAKLLNTTAALAILAGILSGCASSTGDLNPGAAGKLQLQVNALARSAADKDFLAATKTLERLSTDLADAAARGEVSPARRQDIQNAIDLVRADLPAATPAPTPTAAATTQAPAPPTQAPAVSPAAPPAPVPLAPGRQKGNSKGKDD